MVSNCGVGLAVHMTQVHKETLQQVENAIPGRETVDVEIFGMEGIPELELQAHQTRILAQIAQKEAERRVASGQSVAGFEGSSKKKIKVDSVDPEEIMKRLAAHKAAVAGGGISGGGSSGAQSPQDLGDASPAKFEIQGSPVGPPGSYPVSF